MNRVLIAAGLAVAFHAGLFWWGRDWAWAPPATPGINTGMLELTLTTSPGPAMPEKDATVAAGQNSPGPESEQKAAIGPPSPSRQQAREAVQPAIEPAPKAKEQSRPLLPMAAAESPDKLRTDPELQFREKREPDPRAPAMTPAFTEPADNPATAPATEAPLAIGGNEPAPQESGSRKTAAATAGTAGVIAAEPLYRLNPPPPYPPAARQRHYQGTVLLDVLVDEGGRVGELRVVRSSGHPLLDRAALNGVRQWRFEPGRRNGVKIAMWVQIPVRFVLD